MPFAAVETGSLTEIEETFRFGHLVAVRAFVRDVVGGGEYECLERWMLVFGKEDMGNYTTLC